LFLYEAEPITRLSWIEWMAMEESEAYQYFNYLVDHYNFENGQSVGSVIPYQCYQKRMSNMMGNWCTNAYLLSRHSPWQTALWQACQAEPAAHTTWTEHGRVTTIHLEDGRVIARKSVDTQGTPADTFRRQCLLIHEACVYQQLQPYQALGRLPNFVLATALVDAHRSLDDIGPVVAVGDELTSAVESSTLLALYMEAVPDSITYTKWIQLNLPAIHHRLCLLQIVCALLEASELCGFNHLDLHPENILVRRPTRQLQTMIYRIQDEVVYVNCYYQVVIVDLERASCQLASGDRIISECFPFYDPTVNAPWYDIARLCLGLRHYIPEHLDPLLQSVFEGCFHLVVAPEVDCAAWPTWTQVAAQMDDRLDQFEQAEQAELVIRTTQLDLGKIPPTPLDRKAAVSQTWHVGCGHRAESPTQAMPSTANQFTDRTMTARRTNFDSSSPVVAPYTGGSHCCSSGSRTPSIHQSPASIFSLSHHQTSNRRQGALSLATKLTNVCRERLFECLYQRPLVERLCWHTKTTGIPYAEMIHSTAVLLRLDGTEFMATRPANHAKETTREASFTSH
jgi:hypothetical protein